MKGLLNPTPGLFISKKKVLLLFGFLVLYFKFNFRAIELNASAVEEDELDGMTALTVQARLLLNQQILPSSTKSLDSLEGSLDVTDGNTTATATRNNVQTIINKKK